MLSETFKVRFCETDALQHVSNTALPQWFEAAREPIFRIFQPDMAIENWPLIMASMKIDFKAQMYFGHTVEIKTGISRIGNSSFDVLQQVWQQGQCCAQGVTSLVHFDFNQQRSVKISAIQRRALEALLVD